MAIQPFAMQAETAQIQSPMNALMNAQKLKSVETDNAMAENAMMEKSNLDRLYRESGGDINKMIGNPNLGFDAGTKLQSISSENVKAASAAKMGQVDFLTKVNDYTAQLGGAVSDQAGWDQIRQHIGSTLGEEALARMPAQYSEQAKQALLQGSLSLKDKLDIARQERQDKQFERQGAQQDRMYQLALNRDSRAADGDGSGGNDSAKNWDVDVKTGKRYNRATGEVQDLTQNGKPFVPPKGDSDGLIPKEKFQFANTLRDEFNQKTKDFNEVQSQVEKLKKYSEQPSSAGDQAIIFAAMKANDPTSTVRESEFALAASAGGYGEQIQSAFTKVKNGQMLTPAQRADFLETARKGYQVQRKNYKAIEKNYKDLSKTTGVDESMVINPLDRNVFQEPDEPVIGDRPPLDSIFGGQ
jgi:hypothetical protein